LPEWQKKSGSAEILIETNNRSWALQFFMLPPPPPGYPPITITPDEVEIYPKKKRGSRECSPWEYFPSGGERGLFTKVPQRTNK
jgi:hypothetical protein